MPQILRFRGTSTEPLNEIRESIAWARSRGMYVGTCEVLGVKCVSQHSDVLAAWEADDRAPAVNPIGCCILRTQPATSDLEEAAILAVGAPLVWLDGFCQGIAKKEPAPGVVGPELQRFLSGYETGLMIRSWLLRPGSAIVLPGEGISS